ncbi:MAG: AAA family ATPase, partial [Chitinophagales bacterium]
MIDPSNSRDKPKITELQWARIFTAALLEGNIDITTSYNDWLRIGFALASLGEEGRELFHQVSGLHPEYSFDEADAKYSNLIKSSKRKISLSTFIKYCKDAGVQLQNHHFEQAGAAASSYHTNRKNTNTTKVDSIDTEEKWLYNVPDILNAPPEEIIWAFITKGVNNALVASSESGKSTTVLNLGIAIALESETFMDWPLNAPKGRCIYVSTEDGISQINNRLTKMLNGRTIPDNSILFIMDAHNLPIRLEQTLSKHPADLVFIDTWGDLVGGKYDGENTRKTMSEIKMICIKYDCTPVYIHHTNKASENIPEKASIKGAGDFEQACRVVMMLSIYQNDRWLCCVKGNPISEDLKSECHQLKFD